MENNNTKSSTDQKKKKKKKDKKATEGSEVTFDTHTILCCDPSFFNLPIEAYLIHMLNLNMINRDFSLNLLLHRLITQNHMNNISNDSEVPEASNKNAKDKKDKNKKIKKVNPIENGIIQFTNFNCTFHQIFFFFFKYIYIYIDIYLIILLFFFFTNNNYTILSNN